MNTTLLEKHITDGNVKRQKHSSADLWIYNYTPQCQYGRMWDTITKQCRGLILDKDYKYIARPFEKFFNLEELGKEIPDGEIEITEKMDGSLGILYWIDKIPYIATRGSFESDQAKKATQLLWNKYKDAIPKLRTWWTYLFEIIYPANRIVVDYGDDEQLVLLSIVETNTGKEMPLDPELGFPVVHTHKDPIKDLYELAKLNLPNKEGFVIRWKDSNFRAKVKFDEYVRLHRIVTGVSSKTIWEYLSQGLPLRELLDRVPDEFYNWLIKTKVDLQNKYATIEAQCIKDWEEIKGYTIRDASTPQAMRKCYAEHILKRQYPSILFSMLDCKSYDYIIWKLIKPEYECPFKDQGEEI